MGFSVEELFGLGGRVAVLTGATGRLGTVMARTLAAAGAETWIIGRTVERLDALAAEIRDGGGICHPFRCDVTVDADVEALGTALSEGPGRLDVLVHNAHIGRGGNLTTSRPADFAEATDLALSALNRLLGATRSLLAATAIEGGSPSVITVSSMYGMTVAHPELYATAQAASPPYYGAVKAGLLQLTRYAAVELAPLGIRVNSITPGAFPGAGVDPEFLAKLDAQAPLGRVGQAEEIATALLFLASPRSTYVTGSNVVVDGGRTIW